MISHYRAGDLDMENAGRPGAFYTLLYPIIPYYPPFRGTEQEAVKMIRYTTPTLTLTISDEHIDLNLASDVHVTIRQGAVCVDKNADEIQIEENGRTVSCWITQEESSHFQKGNARIQVNWIYDSADGTQRRAATKEKQIQIDENLLQRVIE